jgi:hypothetical protein
MLSMGRPSNHLNLRSSTKTFLVFAICAFIITTFLFDMQSTVNKFNAASQPQTITPSQISDQRSKIDYSPRAVIAAPGTLNIGIGSTGASCTNGQLVMINSSGQAYCGDFNSAFSNKSPTFTAVTTTGAVNGQGGLQWNGQSLDSRYPQANGTGASGTWGINVSGNAATVTNGVYTNSGNRWPGSVWMYAAGNASSNRNWYIGPNDMYWETGNFFHWRNASDGDIATLSTGGALNTNGNITAPNFYATSTGYHFAGNQDMWLYTDGTTQQDMRLQTAAGSAAMRYMGSSGGATYGYTYGDGSGIGFLNSSRGWVLRMNGNDALVSGNINMGGSILYGPGSNTSYGALTIQGSKNGWSGINFKDSAGTNQKTFMIGGGGYSGIYNATDNGWDWLWLNGTLNTGTVPGANVSGNIAGSAANITQYTINQSVGTANSPTFVDVYARRLFVTEGWSVCLDQAGVACMYSSAGASPSPATILQARASAFSAVTVAHLQANGNFYALNQIWSGACGCVFQASDIRLKKNVETIDGALNKLTKLRGVTFEWATPEEVKKNGAGKKTGWVAQEVEKVFPEWVNDRGDGYKGVGPQGFEALVVEAFKDVVKKIDEITADVKKLLAHDTVQDQQVKELQKQVEELKTEVQKLKAVKN